MEAIDKIKAWSSALADVGVSLIACLLYTSPSPRDED